jgi:adenylylsulfate kinase-like enzyme
MFLESQGFLVICSILSIFREHQRLNRKKFSNYFQIYIKSKITKLKKRNNKKIYSFKNVVGKKIKFPKPYKSDLIIENNYLPYPLKKIDKIIKKINASEKN